MTSYSGITIAPQIPDALSLRDRRRLTDDSGGTRLLVASLDVDQRSKLEEIARRKRLSRGCRRLGVVARRLVRGGSWWPAGRAGDRGGFAVFVAEGCRGRAAGRGDHGALPCPWRRIAGCRGVVVPVPEGCRAGRGEFSSRGAFPALSRGQLSVLRELSAVQARSLRVIMTKRWALGTARSTGSGSGRGPAPGPAMPPARAASRAGCMIM